MKVQHSGDWQTPADAQVARAGRWERVTGAYILAGGSWTPVWPNEPASLALTADQTAVELGAEVTFTVTARDSRGTPLPGTPVVLCHGATGVLSWVVWASGLTGPDGTFTSTITETRPAEWLYHAGHPHGAHDAHTVLSPQVGVTVTDPVSMTIHADPNPAITGSGWLLAGTVTVGGTPAPDGEVVIQVPVADQWQQYTGAALTNGHWSRDNLTLGPGEHTLRAAWQDTQKNWHQSDPITVTLTEPGLPPTPWTLTPAVASTGTPTPSEDTIGQKCVIRVPTVVQDGCPPPTSDRVGLIEIGGDLTVTISGTDLVIGDQIAPEITWDAGEFVIEFTIPDAPLLDYLGQARNPRLLWTGRTPTCDWLADYEFPDTATGISWQP